MTRRTGDLRIALGLALFALAPGSTRAQSPEKLTVVAQLRSSQCYVGQAVELVVGVMAERERPQVVEPKVEGATVSLYRTEQRPVSTSGIGDVVWEQNLFRYRFHIVPRRAGAITIPRVVATLGNRKGASDPTRLTAHDVPLTGRPATFLGGVGPFTLEATAEPQSIRTGQSFTYRLTVSGPGARGVTGGLDLERLRKSDPALRITPQPAVTQAEPPSHTFVTTLRATRAGALTIPPISISSFDPATSQFTTKVAPSVAIRVTDVPIFDEGALGYAPLPARPAPRWSWTQGLVALLGVVVASLFGYGVVRWFRTTAPARARRRLIRRLERSLEESHRLDTPETGRILNEAMAELLQLEVGRPPGALTPDDAAEGVFHATSSEALRDQARALIQRADRAEFAGSAVDDALAKDGLILIRSIGDALTRPASAS